MAASEQLKQLVSQLPNPDINGMYTETVDKAKLEKASDAEKEQLLAPVKIDKQKIEQITAEIARGGKENVLGLIDMLAEPGSDADVKPHYALHCVANYALRSRDEKARRDFAEVLAGQLAGNRSKYIRGYLCQELQWAGRKEAVPALAALLADEELVDAAAMALVAIQDGAADAFAPRCPAPRAAAGW